MLSTCLSLPCGPAHKGRCVSARFSCPVAQRPSLRSRARLVTRASVDSADPAATSEHVTEVTSEAQFDELIANAGSKLVVVDCGATWCGPCKLFKPIFAQFADSYHAQAQFVAITGDLNPSTASLMKRLNVKSVPAFFFYKDGKQVQAFTGANKQGFRNNLSEYITL